MPFQWNRCVCAIIAELDNYVTPGSEALIISDLETGEAETACMASNMRNLQVSFRAGDTTDRAVLEALDVPSYQHVIILCYSDALDSQEADARTLITLLHLRNIADQSGHPFGIVSDALTSLMLAQISENKALSQVFADLFDADGSEVYLKPVSDYVALEQPVNFYTLVEAARRRGEVAIGYRQQANANNAGKSYGVVVNPNKSEQVAYVAADRVIVLAES